MSWKAFIGLILLFLSLQIIEVGWFLLVFIPAIIFLAAAFDDFEKRRR